MRKFLMFFLLVTSMHVAQAQIEFGIKGGLNSIDLITDVIQVNNGSSHFDLKFNTSKYGHHFGVYTNVRLLNFYVEPSVMFNSNSVNYLLSDYTEDGLIETVKNETYHNLDIPVMLGIKAGVIRLYGGPVMHVHLNASSDLLDVDGYEAQYKKSTWGYQGGFGLNLWKLRLDIAYEGNLSKFGDHINIGGEHYSFSQNPSRILGSVSYAF